MNSIPARTALEVERVSHSYGAVAVLHEVSLSVDAGEVHCLLGPSGCGKSTLLRLIAGLEELQSGAIRLAGNAVASCAPGGAVWVPPERRSVGFVFQDYALFPHLNAKRNVQFGMPKPERGAADERAKQASELLERVGMTAFASAMPHTLSGGQQQRVALARALARGPEVMLLDEPFSGLDDRLRVEVRERTLEVLRASQIAAVIVTHDPQEALQLGDRISVMEVGRIRQTGTPDELLHAAQTVDVAQVFGAVNVFESEVRDGRSLLPWGPVQADVDAGASAVTAMVRAEHLELLSAEKGSPHARVRVKALEPANGAVTLRLELLDSGRELTAIDSVRTPWQVGDQAAVQARPERVMIGRHGN